MARMMTSTISELEELHQAARTASIEQAYDKSIHDYTSIIADEESRRLRLQVVLLEHTNDDLNEQLAEEKKAADVATEEAADLVLQLDEGEEFQQQLQIHLRQHLREIETLKTELDVMKDVSIKATQHLTEKLALQHELANLKPEIEHLRAQSNSHQAVLSEKLALQRQLDTVRAQIESDKRESQRAMAAEESEAAREAHLQEQIAALGTDLTREVKQREKLEEESRKAATGWDTKRSVLESKLDAMRTKLRSTKEQLKECQAELKKALELVANAEARESTAIDGDRVSRNPRKRTAAQIDNYATIGTPDGVHIKGAGPGARRGQRASSAMPGEKSTFSITPFLNRTSSIAPDTTTHNADEVEEDEVEVSMIVPTMEVPVSNTALAVVLLEPTGKGTKKAAQPRGKSCSTSSGILSNASHKANIKAPGRKRATASTTVTLENVLEEEELQTNHVENDPPAQATLPTKPTTQVPLRPAAIISNPIFGDDIEGGKKKKRKFLGGPGLAKTLFDDDDADAAKPMKAVFSGARAFPSWIKAGKAGVRGPLGPIAGTSGGGTFGAFSPLKKDRRAGGNDTTIQ